MGLSPYKNEPYLDWTDESNRKAMRAALKEVGNTLGKSYPLTIGGRPVETDGEIISVNPSNPSQVVGHLGRATGHEADTALERPPGRLLPGARRSPKRGRVSFSGRRR